MGDFDKNQAGAASAADKEKKKLIMVGVLGAVLVGVLAFHFMKGSPQAASAAGPEAIEVPAAVEQTPAEALASLDASRDPTRDLLRGSATLPEALTQVPRNPFKLSDKWLATLVKPAEPVKTAGPSHLEPVHSSQPAPAAEPAINPEGLKLAGIFRVDNKLYASINGSLVTAGSTLGNARIVDITDDKVILRHVDYPNGPTTVLKITTKKFGN